MLVATTVLLGAAGTAAQAADPAKAAAKPLDFTVRAESSPIAPGTQVLKWDAAKSHWGVMLNLQQPDTRATTLNDIQAGAYYKITPALRVGGAVAFGEPTTATATFRLTPAQTNISGIRLIGDEGGTASGGFLGVFELAVLTTIPQPVTLLNPQVVPGGFRFEFNSQLAVSHTVQRKSRLTDLSWETLSTISGDGTRKQVTNNLVAPSGFYRITSE